MITNSPLIPSVKPTLDAIVALARDLVQADVVTIHLYDSRTSTFNLYSGVGAGREFGTPRKEGTSSYIVERGRPVITNNTLKHPQFRDNPFTRSRNVRSAAGFPLLVDDTVSGVLYINYHKPRQLTRARV